MNPARLFPRMFHRRLTLLLAGLMVVMVILSGQLARLTVVRGAELRERAESRLEKWWTLPTYRGRILDRNGREIAIDRANYEVAVDYEVISGDWTQAQARRLAQREVGSIWYDMTADQRRIETDMRRREFELQVEEVWRAIARHTGMPRAEVDEKVEAIRARVTALAEAVWENQRAAHYAKYGEPKADEKDTFEPKPIAEQRTPHVIVGNLSDQVAFEFMRLSEGLPGLQVLDSRRREYPWSTVRVTIDQSTLPKPIRKDESATIEAIGVADHILGQMREQVWAEDIARRPFRRDGAEVIDRGGYMPGDSVGHRGLESIYEDQLRGLRGVVHRRLDTGAERREEPDPGDDLIVALDVRLQARVQALFDPALGLARVQQWHAGWNNDGTPRGSHLPIGTPLNGSAVVIDVDSGEILAMVSVPTIAQGERMTTGQRAITAPFVNRAVETPYPPGSIIKPLVLSAAVGQGVHDLSRGIPCTGHYFENDQIARCWIYREIYGFTNHSERYGALDGETALSVSCNIYFYTLADRLGMENLSSWYRRFGLGRRPDTGLLYTDVTPEGQTRVLGENAGDVPSESIVNELKQTGGLRFASVIMGIGQGPVTWTPVQAANAYATIARGGHYRSPTVLRGSVAAEMDRHEDDLRIRPDVVATILEGLRQSVEESHGTGHAIRYADRSTEPIINAEGVTVWAKTGTAQAPPLRVDSDGDGEPDSSLTGLDHAWFVGLVGAGEKNNARPRYAIAVVLEYAGSGGRAAGPIANQIIHALKAEGYL